MIYKGYEIQHMAYELPDKRLQAVKGVVVTTPDGERSTLCADVEIAKRYIDSKVERNK